jgi:hypothetical protein
MDMTNYQEVYRPVTEEYARFEEHYLPAAEEEVIAFREKGEAISIWQQHEDISSRRIHNLSQDELQRQIDTILRLCEVPEDFHRSIRILKTPRETKAPNESTFGEHTPSPLEIFRWLSEDHLELHDEPNDFQVGFAIETDNGLVVCKFQSEECAFVCENCSREMAENNQNAAHAQYSCDHNEGIYSYIFDYQISLYPKEDLKGINWYQSWPQNEP